MHLAEQRLIGLAIWMVTLPALIRAGPVAYEERSEPPGVILGRSAALEAGTSVATINAPVRANGYGFGYWTINGEPVRSFGGRGLSIATFVLDVPTMAVARYFPEAQDADGDYLSDWWEWNRFGSLGFDRAADPDGDGIEIAVEYTRGYEPTNVDTFSEGGQSRAESTTLLFHDPDGWLAYTFLSRPLGLVDMVGIDAIGGHVFTPNLQGDDDGWMFVGWETGGIRQTGRPLSLEGGV